MMAANESEARAGNSAASESPLRMSDALQRYFSRYPRRESGFPASFFRQGEHERFDILRRWMPPCDGLTILDAGCGDGEFLRALIDGCPRLIRLEDVVARWTQIATDRLREVANQVESQIGDIRSMTDPAQYDIVLALGIFDYEADWHSLLQRLVQRCRGQVFTDFPKRGTAHSWMRRIWLRLHGIHLYSTDRRSLESLLQRLGVPSHIEELPLQWVVRIDVAP